MESNENISISNIVLMESNFFRDKIIDFSDPNLKNNINIHLDNVVADNFLETTLMVTFTAVINEKTIVEAKIKMLAIFEFTTISSVNLETFKEINAPAIIYPYIREHLTSLSTKALLTPIIIPPVNFVKLAEQNKAIKE
jgi:preprotein translocase subunit SecB